MQISNKMTTNARHFGSKRKKQQLASAMTHEPNVSWRQARNQFGTPGEAKSFLWGPNVSNFVQ